MPSQNEEEAKNNEEEEVEERDSTPISFILEDSVDDEINTIFFTGEVSEERANHAIMNLVACKKSAANKEEPEDITLYLNTEGGSAYEMFAIYDVMQDIKTSVDVSVIGIGKVMSAGVLLLAGGTPGKRKVGRHTRIMIHNVITGQTGAVHIVEHELKEVKRIQKMYVKCLAESTNLTEPAITRLLRKNKNVYISAEEAVEYGIADEIL